MMKRLRSKRRVQCSQNFEKTEHFGTRLPVVKADLDWWDEGTDLSSEANMDSSFIPFLFGCYDGQNSDSQCQNVMVIFKMQFAKTGTQKTYIFR